MYFSISVIRPVQENSEYMHIHFSSLYNKVVRIKNKIKIEVIEKLMGKKVGIKIHTGHIFR